MSFFYDLNKKLNSLSTEAKQIAESVEKARAEVKSPARITLEESLKQDMKALMEDGTGGMNFSGSGSMEEGEYMGRPAKYGVVVVGHNGGKPVKTFDNEADAKAYANKGIRIDGKLLQGSVRTMVDETGYSAKKAAAGKDIGKPGKNFAKIAKSAGKEYGSKEAGERVAGAVLNKLRAAKESVEEAAEELADKDYDKDGKVESPKAEYMGARIAAGKRAAEKMKEQISSDEQVNELSPDTLKSYAKKAAGSVANKGAELGQKMAAADEVDRYTNRHMPNQSDERERMRGAVGAGYDDISRVRSKANQRVKGIGKAVDRLTKEDGLPDIADKVEKMRIARGNVPVSSKAGPLKNVGKGLKAFFKGEPEPMDEEQEMIRFLTQKANGSQGHAEPHPYNDSEGADAYNGMEFESSMMDEEMTLEAVSRKHFQQVADLLRNIENPEKRKEMAMHHAAIFRQQNPRFDIQRFGQAAGVDLSECGLWEELTGGQKKLDVDGDGDIGADDLADLRAGHEVDEGFADMDRWLAQREKEKGTGKFDSRKVSTGTVYTRKPETFAGDDEEVSEPSAKRGRGRPAGVKKAIGARGPSGKSKLMTKEGDEEVDEEKQEAGKRKFFDKLAPAAKKVAKVVSKVTGGKKKEVDEEATEKEDKKAEKAGKKVAKDIEHDEGNKSKGDNKAEKAGKKVTKDIEFDDKKDKKEKKEEKVDETTTSGSVATVAAGKSGAGSVGKGIYDSWNREFNNLLAESLSVKEETTMAEHAEDGDAETMTITATGDDVARLRDILAQLGVTQSSPSEEEPYANSEEPCGTCGGVPCQCDELGAEVLGLPGAIEFEIDEADMEEGNEFSGELAKAKAQHQDEFEVDGETYQVKEANAPVSDNSPDYPTNQECSDDALQYSGGLNKPKATGQTTIPVVASQLSRQVSNESKDSVDSFLNLYKAFKTK